MSGFKMNPGLERALQREVQAGMKNVARDLTKEINRFQARYRNQPIGVVKPALARFFRQQGLSVNDRDLSYYADQISSGSSIEFNA